MTIMLTEDSNMTTLLSTKNEQLTTYLVPSPPRNVQSRPMIKKKIEVYANSVYLTTPPYAEHTVALLSLEYS